MVLSVLNFIKLPAGSQSGGVSGGTYKRLRGREIKVHPHLPVIFFPPEPALAASAVALPLGIKGRGCF